MSSSNEIKKQPKYKKVQPIMCTISYTMLDDLKHIYGFPIHRRIQLTRMDILDFINHIVSLYKRPFARKGKIIYDERGCCLETPLEEKARLQWDKINEDKKHDPSHFWYGVPEYGMMPANRRQIATSILYDGYYCQDQLNSYYVVAFAINAKQFYVYSKDCKMKLIDWKYIDDEEVKEDEQKKQGVVDQKVEEPVIVVVPDFRSLYYHIMPRS